MTQNIYCIGRNYRAHAKELGNEVPDIPVVFLVTSSSIRNFNDSQLAFANETFHFEGELILKVGKDHQLGENYCEDSIEALACGIDLTRRVEQSRLKEKGLPLTTSKSFFGSSIVGDFYPISKFESLDSIAFEFYLNGVLRQSGNTRDMLFSFREIINYLNSFSPLKKGDLIFTGTPEGVGEIIKGDDFKFVIPELKIIEQGKL